MESSFYIELALA